MLRKIAVLIGSMLLSGVALAEDAPLPFDDPAAAPPIVRKANPAKAAPAPVAVSTKQKAVSKGSKTATSKATKNSRKANKAKSTAAKSSAKSKSSVKSKKSSKAVGKATKPAASSKKTKPSKAKSTRKK